MDDIASICTLTVGNVVHAAGMHFPGPEAAYFTACGLGFGKLPPGSEFRRDMKTPVVVTCDKCAAVVRRATARLTESRIERILITRAG